MRQRVISAIIGLLLFIAVMALFGTIVPNIAIALLAGMAVWELLNATGCAKNKLLCLLSLAFAVAVPFLSFTVMVQHLMLICFAYILGIFFTLLYYHNTLSIQQASMAFMFSLLIPFSLTSLLYLRDRLGIAQGIFYTFLTFASAWLSDTFAYFTGRKWGKHKLAPIISPKKTVEGAFGGIIGSMAGTSLLLWVVSFILEAAGMPIRISFPQLLCVIPPLSAISIAGDLSASVIKRQFGVKDYGSIMPGHGGVMDRFDSVLLTAPLVFLISRYFPLVTAG